MIGTIFKKEMLDTLRDRRTVMTMIVIPTMIFPAIMTIFVKVSGSFNRSAAEKEIFVGIASEEVKPEFVLQINQLPAALGKRQVSEFKDSSEIQRLINNDSLDIGFFVPSTYALVHDSSSTVNIKAFYRATDLGMQERAEVLVTAIQKQLQKERYDKLEVAEEQLEPLAVSYHNVASDKETLGMLIGGFLPYLFIAFGFMGCMYPAIDLFTGEKERGTLETLLTTPASRWQILLGKMGVVVLSGILAASFTLVGIFLALEVFDLIQDPKIIEIIHQILTLKFVLLFYLLLIPLIVFFAGVMIPIAVYAKTFKEAQSVIAPMNAVIVLPAMVGFFPGIELNLKTACVPIINIVLASKELIAGTLHVPYVLLSFAIMVAIALFFVFLSYRRFGKESNLVSG